MEDNGTITINGKQLNMTADDLLTAYSDMVRIN